MKILLFGYSSLAIRKIIPALEKSDFIISFECASLSKNVPNNCYKKLVRIYYSYEIAIKSSDADFVYISTTNNKHAELIELSLNHNKNIIVDKPAVLYLEDAKRLFDLANKKKKIIVEAITYKFHPQIDFIKKYSTQINQITVNFSVPGFEITNFRYSNKLGGGVVYDMAPYAIDIGKTIFKSNPIFLCGKLIKNKVYSRMNIIIEFEKNKIVNGFFGFESEYVNNGFFLGNNILLSTNRLFTSDSNKDSTILMRKKNVSKNINFNPSDSFVNFFRNLIVLNKKEFKKINSVFLQQATDMSNLIKEINK